MSTVLYSGDFHVLVVSMALYQLVAPPLSAKTCFSAIPESDSLYSSHSSSMILARLPRRLYSTDLLSWTYFSYMVLDLLLSYI